MRRAIRSACRSDYQAHCASVPPGSIASLQCLQKNMSSLLSSCQTAVRAVEPPAASKAESAPATEPAKPAAETAATPAAEAATATPAKKPSSAQVAAIRSVCRSDYQRTCAGVPTGGAVALNCLETNKSKLSVGGQHAVGAASGGGATPAAGGAAADAGSAAAPAAAPALTLRPMRPREELFVVRSACGETFARFARASRSAAAALSSASRPKQPRCHLRARAYWPSSPRDRSRSVRRRSAEIATISIILHERRG
jgi:hypothetical protein